MIKPCLEVSHIINVNEDSQDKRNANEDSQINFWKFWLMPFCFMMEKDHFK